MNRNGSGEIMIKSEIPIMMLYCNQEVEGGV